MWLDTRDDQLQSNIDASVVCSDLSEVLREKSLASCQRLIRYVDVDVDVAVNGNLEVSRQT